MGGVGHWVQSNLLTCWAWCQGAICPAMGLPIGPCSYLMGISKIWKIELLVPASLASSGGKNLLAQPVIFSCFPMIARDKKMLPHEWVSHLPLFYTDRFIFIRNNPHFCGSRFYFCVSTADNSEKEHILTLGRKPSCLNAIRATCEAVLIHR